jgi:hypothetical protein
LVEHKFLPNDFDLDAFIDPAPLREAQRIVKERAQKKQKQQGNQGAQAAALP